MPTPIQYTESPRDMRCKLFRSSTRLKGASASVAASKEEKEKSACNQQTIPTLAYHPFPDTISNNLKL